jgi:hypothetical protein
VIEAELQETMVAATPPIVTVPGELPKFAPVITNPICGGPVFNEIAVTVGSLELVAPLVENEFCEK